MQWIFCNHNGGSDVFTEHFVFGFYWTNNGDSWQRHDARWSLLPSFSLPVILNNSGLRVVRFYSLKSIENCCLNSPEVLWVSQAKLAGRWRGSLSDPLSNTQVFLSHLSPVWWLASLHQRLQNWLTLCVQQQKFRFSNWTRLARLKRSKLWTHETRRHECPHRLWM